MQRRDFLLASGGLLAATAVPGANILPPTFSLGFSLYGMKSLSTLDALEACRKIGYQCTELPLMVDWPADSSQLTKTDIEAIRATSVRLQIPIVALMENLRLVVDDKQHAQNLARLTRACEIAKQLAPERPPLVETVLGGSPQQWDAVKETMVTRLREWAKIADAAGVTLAIKAHVGNAAHRPEHIVWLLDEVKSKVVCAAFDYSHFQLQGLKLEESFIALAPKTSFIHVKDAIGTAAKFKFVLPGEGETDYKAYFQLLRAQNFTGPVMVEVSGQVSSQPGYNPLAAAQRCWDTLHAARKTKR